MYDIFYLGPRSDNWLKLKARFPLARRADTFDEIKTKTYTKFFWVVWGDLLVSETFDFSYEPDSGSQEYVHVFKNGEFYDGVCLFPSTAEPGLRELEYRFFTNKKEVDIRASTPINFDIFYISTYDEYLQSVETSCTDMFWAVWNDIEVNKDFNFDYYIPVYDSYHRQITHVFKNGNFYDGICLFSKTNIISKKEFDYRFFTNKKEVDILASQPIGFEKFNITTYDEYLEICKLSNTRMFWAVWDDVEVKRDFNFDYQVPFYEQHIAHVFKNGNFYDGICLFSKTPVSKKEFDYRFFSEKKEVDVTASTPKGFDIFFISYDEPNADKNFNLLSTKFPNSKRIHGVKGIHQAHATAARESSTRMFYVVDGDAVIEDSFNFDHQVPYYSHDLVHVWLSRNPINGLEYGYGGVKLLPKRLTESLDTTTADMTTSISAKFKVESTVSNLTEFNTDEFNTWKSAFRECAKLASGVIHNADPDDSMARLIVWTTVGANQPFGNFALDGAKQGRDFGFENSNNRDKLRLINDFDWLKEKFDNDCKVRS